MVTGLKLEMTDIESERLVVSEATVQVLILHEDKTAEVSIDSSFAFVGTEYDWRLLIIHHNHYEKEQS